MPSGTSSIPAPTAPASSATGIVRVAFIATICVSAFLLFLIQPMFSKMVVPLVGGSSAVWTTAMLFFQSVLLAGYAYAHWLASSFTIARQRHIHLFVTAVAVLALPLAVPQGWIMPDDGLVAPWLLALFAVSIGAPFFALSANSPLLQSWYAASGNPDGEDPYFLYAASNIGSFGALVAYPLLIEPSSGLADQGAYWSGGYLILMVGLACTGFLVRGETSTSVEAGEDTPATPLGRRTVLYWMLLSFVPSSLMLSITAKISMDVGSFPLIWVTTLGLYLLTYVFAFSGQFRARAGALPRLHMLLSIAMLAFLTFDKEGAQGGFEFAFMLAFLFVAALAFHTRLAENRPQKAHLTAFFLSMSAGGALGGVFNSLLAPMLFDNLYELPIVIALAFIASPKGMVAWRRDTLLAGLAGTCVLALVLLRDAVSVDNHRPYLQLAITWTCTGGAAFALLYWAGKPLRQTVLAVCTLAAINLASNPASLITRERSFFGVYEIHDNPDEGYRFIKHGTTNHGIILTDGPVQRPAAYYGYTTPFGQFMDMMEAGDTVGVVGLGAGAVACLRPGEVSKVFYEIDPLVDRLARDPRYFTLLRDCAPKAPTVIGDARIKMQDVAPAAHNHIMLDAFSSDAIPAHLLTREAFETYDRIVPEDGGIFVHISNRHYQLEGPVTRIAESMGFKTYFQAYFPDEEDKQSRTASTIAVILTRGEALGAKLETDPRWQTAKAWDGPIWADNYADTLAAWK